MRRVCNIDYRLLSAFGVLLIFGLFMLSSSSAATAFSRLGDSYFYLKKQIILGVFPGVIGLLFFMKIDYKLFKRFSLSIFAVILLFLVLVLFPSIGVSVGGARRWIAIGGNTFQPSEIAKLAFIIYLSAWLSEHSRELSDLRKGLVPFVVLTGIVAGLIMAEPDLGTTMIFGLIAFSVYFLAGAPLKYIYLMITGGLVAVAGLIAVAPYRIQRIQIFLKPELDPLGMGYHINQAFMAIGSGGFWGKGFGHSRAKFQYLPEASGDSIFAIIGEELGFIISALFIILLLYIFFRCMKIAKKAPDDFSKYMVSGIAVWFIGQSLINISAMIGLLPLTGVPLPFVSYGGTALAISLSAVGIVMNISRFTEET